jgi:RNA polymerase sigma factor (TIGR02999 family)
MTSDSDSQHTVTVLLEAARHGDSDALDRLSRMVHAELHRIAERHMQRERDDHTLQPTVLVHEAILRLTGSSRSDFNDRVHFFRAASQVMRRVLVDHARARQAAKRGGGLRVTLDENFADRAAGDVDLLVLDEALTRLAAAEPRWAQVVELRFFTGLGIEETAETLDVSPATVKRDWQFARAWLARELGNNGA